MHCIPIYGLTQFTMQDFPGHLAAIIWIAGCNLRCVYCHNPEMICGKGNISTQKVLTFLQKRQGQLDAVVLSGGEATVYNALPDFIRAIRQCGSYKIKLDTNGTRPECVQQLLKENLVDYIALDYKAPEKSFGAVTGRQTHYKSFRRTLEFLATQNQVPFEIRTTVHTDVITEPDIVSMMDDLDDLSCLDRYVIQKANAYNGHTYGGLRDQAYPLDINFLASIAQTDIRFRNF